MVATRRPVCMLTSYQPTEESGTALAAIAGGHVHVVFCAPERFGQRSFLQAVARNRVDLFVVDEAHCLVEWGDNFRPEYARLAEWRDTLGAKATLALTATATPKSDRRLSAAWVCATARAHDGIRPAEPQF